MISHPFIENKLIFIRCHELFTLNGILISLRSLIHEKKIVDEEIANKLNDLILLIKLVDTYNGINKKYTKMSSFENFYQKTLAFSQNL